MTRKFNIAFEYPDGVVSIAPEPLTEQQAASVVKARARARRASNVQLGNVVYPWAWTTGVFVLDVETAA